MRLAPLLLLGGLLAATAAFTPHRAEAAPTWHKSLKDGIEASSKSGKPALVVTLWKEKV